MATEKVRIDKYLWSIRIFKTRKLAAEACQKGRVKLNASPVKPSRDVTIGDQYDIRGENRPWVIRVTALLSKRVDYQTSLQYYSDETPEPEEKEKQSSSFVFFTGKRKSKQGRPTKRDKRRLDDFLE